MISTPRGRNRTVGRWRDAAIVAMVAALGIGLNTNLYEPPRFDGAGYAMLARSLQTGQGYRNIDHPDQTPHAHFPPGYPLLLAAVWEATGPSVVAAHVVSVLCTVAAAVAAWIWFRWQYRRRVALLMGLALAMNWTWHRVGGSIRSEPPYMLLKQLSLLATVAAMRGGLRRGVRLGALLGLTTLTRHVGAAVDLAVGMELAIRRRWKTLAASVTVAALIVAPWAFRLLTTPRPTQLGLLPGPELPGVIAHNAWFYTLRLPDALSGPIVEFGTVFAPRAYEVVAPFAVLATGILMWGLVIVLRTERLRTAGLVVASNLALFLVWPFTEAGRFLVPLVPALLVVAVEALAAILRRLRVRLRTPRLWAALVLLLAATPYSVYAIVFNRAAAERDDRSTIDAACLWIERHGDRPGPLMTAYPAESFWMTSRPGLIPPENDAAIAEAIDRYHVAYLLVTEDRFTAAPESPLAHFVSRHPDRVALVWSSPDQSVQVFEIQSP